MLRSRESFYEPHAYFVFYATQSFFNPKGTVQNTPENLKSALVNSSFIICPPLIPSLCMRLNQKIRLIRKQLLVLMKKFIEICILCNYISCTKISFIDNLHNSKRAFEARGNTFRYHPTSELLNFRLCSSFNKSHIWAYNYLCVCLIFPSRL